MKNLYLGVPLLKTVFLKSSLVDFYFSKLLSPENKRSKAPFKRSKRTFLTIFQLGFSVCENMSCLAFISKKTK